MKYAMKMAAGLLLSLGWLSVASAHAHLESATPAQDATVGSPAELALHFTEGLEPALSGVALTAGESAPIELGKAQTAKGDDKTLLVPVPQPLKPGAYTVNWHVLAKDGHKSKGSYTFTVKP
ncbi:copper homeostasis periplasmic binding protein CopC [Pusillimonas sp. ANT_WB101]|uniref:copper homeostasis periplasmic binding protein CopC n=1 Tax=Pusillimonas sp. ANT_WB101 TaxID=2597356 RepID=UPI0011EEC9E4|nr:copper homeostasis periplasmic binding protein CopC [Pusillimonas sp. ANT_WB101]KAA0891124.1 copper homeostasis periplasmic binding protein CopC [Pusillimonas sp. ANT_WB101]